MNERIRSKKLLKKVCSAEEAAKLIKDNMVIGCSGFTPSGYPKAVPLALAEKVKKSGEQLKIDLLTGASVGEELDGKLVEAGIVKRRYPYQSNSNIRKGLNNGKLAYCDIHLSHFPQQVSSGLYGKLDYAVIEAASITEQGHIIPTTSVGAAPSFASKAKKIIVEINKRIPTSIEGIHDIYQLNNPPYRKPINLKKTDDRIGTPYIEVDPKKIEAIVITDLEDSLNLSVFQNEISKKIASNIINFLEEEVSNKRLPKNLLPLQSGVGAVANAVLAGLKESRFKNLEFYSEVIQDAVFDLIDCNKIKVASGTSITASKDCYNKFINNIDFYKEKIILRPQEISNNPEIIRRLGSISINTAIEVDIYGNVNSTNIMGSKMMNGIGGSGDFARNAYLSIFVTCSTAKNGDISTVVPMVSHLDHTEHDVDILVTEQGIADLRGLSPRERAIEVINSCVHPDYKEQLSDYYERAVNKGGHTPHLLKEALSWHQRFLDKGTMKNI